MKGLGAFIEICLENLRLLKIGQKHQAEYLKKYLKTF
jgi:hypothetical protein